MHPGVNISAVINKSIKDLKKAIIALARKLLVIIYTILKTDSLFNEQCFETRKIQYQRKRVSKLIYELAQMGYDVKSIS